MSRPLPLETEAALPLERRRHRRRSVFRSAQLVLHNASAGIGCTVLDESPGGVQLALEAAGTPELPEELMLKFGAFATRLVRRRWAKGNRAGYEYLEGEAAEPAAEPEPKPLAPALAFVAFNDFIHISPNLLHLRAEPPDWLYPAEEIHARLLRADETALPAWNERGQSEQGRRVAMRALTPAANEIRLSEMFFGPLWLPCPASD